MSKKTIIILAVIVLVILASIGGVFYLVSGNKSNVANPQIPSTQQPNTKNSGVQKVDLAKPPMNNGQNPQPIPKRELTANETVPTISATANKDISQGYNLKIATTNFNFINENKSEELASNNGYVKLYVNNIFSTRIYGSDYYLRLLKPGKYNIKLELSDTKGRSLSKDGKVIESVT